MVAGMPGNASGAVIESGLALRLEFSQSRRRSAVQCLVGSRARYRRKHVLGENALGQDHLEGYVQSFGLELRLNTKKESS